MTSAAFSMGRRTRAEALPIARVLMIALVGVLVVSLPNLIDPMIRYDDYPALLALPSWFWGKTLGEGRWINYLWHLRSLVTPSWLNFAVYQVLWAVLAAALAVAATEQTEDRSEDRWFAGLLALFIAVAPPATAIVLWFNTLIPGLAIVALYAVLGCKISQGWHRALLLPFTIVTFMTYATYPLILLAVCLFRTERRSLFDLAGLLALFVVSFAVAVMVAYAINWQIHGVFGIPLADWRDPNPASDLAGIIANLPMLKYTFWALLESMSFGLGPLAGIHFMILTLATAYLARLAPKEALYLHAGLWIGVALTAAQVLKLGVQVPPRSFAFAWILYAAIVVRATTLLSRDSALLGRIGRNISLLIVIGYMVVTFFFFTTFRAWQSETRELAQAVLQTNGNIIVTGNVMELSSASLAGIQSELALSFRIKQLTGHEIIICNSKQEVCMTMEGAAVKLGVSPQFHVGVTQSNGETRLTYSPP